MTERTPNRQSADSSDARRGRAPRGVRTGVPSLRGHVTRREGWRILAGCAVAALSGCGYQVGGRGDLIPKSVKTIAVPTFANRTTQYKLRDSVPIAIAREFRARTKYQIVNDPNLADAVLRGEITLVGISPTIYDPTTSKATAIGIEAYLNLKLVERATGKVIWSKYALHLRENYELAVDPSKYFDESDFATSRLSQTIASTVVNLILEAF
jgi:lipopolysaccharide assembly LptE-like protein